MISIAMRLSAAADAFSVNFQDLRHSCPKVLGLASSRHQVDHASKRVIVSD